MMTHGFVDCVWCYSLRGGKLEKKNLGEETGKRDCTYSTILGLKSLKSVGQFSWKCVRCRRAFRIGA